GTIVTAADTYKGDVLVVDEKIAMIGKGLKAAGAKRIDATGKYVIPGGIDVHTHMELPFGGTFASDDFYTGTVAAAFGGTTSIVDFAVQGMGEPLEKARDAWLRKARGKAAIDYGLHMIVRDVTDKVLKEMDVMVKEGVSSFKLFMAYPGVFQVDDGSIFKAISRTAENGGLICMHAENGGVIDVLVKRALAAKHTEPKWHALTRPPEAEGEATNRAFRLAEMAGGIPLYIVHLSSSQALEQVRLFHDGGVVQKRITLNRWVEVTSTTPAKIMGMFPRKGTIAVGSDADIVVWDPRTTSTISAKTHHMRVDYNPYEGRKVKGKASVVLSR